MGQFHTRMAVECGLSFGLSGEKGGGGVVARGRGKVAAGSRGKAGRAIRLGACLLGAPRGTKTCPSRAPRRRRGFSREGDCPGRTREGNVRPDPDAQPKGRPGAGRPGGIRGEFSPPSAPVRPQVRPQFGPPTTTLRLFGFFPSRVFHKVRRKSSFSQTAVPWPRVAVLSTLAVQSPQVRPQILLGRS